jgi:tRNA pseudouridine38-40 synthase
MEFRYDGSLFSGFQRQNKDRSVQKDIEDVLTSIYGEKIVIKGAGRTDAGVHALGQTATFDVPYYIEQLKDILNEQLSDIVIKRLKVVDEDFHARFSAIGKIYLYKIKLNSKGKNPYYICLKNVDINKMKEVAKLFVGTHNFKNFVSGERDDYETVIKSIKFYKVFNYMTIKFEGVGFYRYMVRNLVGAMIDVGKGKVEIEEVKNMLEHPEKTKQLSTALPNGLYLYKVLY